MITFIVFQASGFSFAEVESLPSTAKNAANSLLQKSMQKLSGGGGSSSTIMAHTANVGSVIGVQNNGPITNNPGGSSNQNGQSSNNQGQGQANPEPAAGNIAHINIFRGVRQRSPQQSPNTYYQFASHSQSSEYQRSIIALYRKKQKEEALKKQAEQQARMKKQQEMMRQQMLQQQMLQQQMLQQKYYQQSYPEYSGQPRITNNNNINVNTGRNGITSEQQQIIALHKLIEKLV